MDILLPNLGGELLQRAEVIDDVQASAVRGDHEVAFPRMNEDVIHGDRGELPELEPPAAALDGGVEPELRAGEQQVRVGRILSEDLYRPTLRQVAGDTGPRLPPVRRPVRQRGVDARSMTVD